MAKANVSQAKIDLIINDEKAQQSLRELAVRYKELQNLKHKALKDNDIKLYEAVARESNSIGRQINDTTKKVVDVENVLKNLNKVSLSELRSAATSLSNSMRTLSRDSVEYKDKAQKLVRIQEEIAQSTGRAVSRIQSLGDKLRNSVFTFDLGSIVSKMQGQLAQSIDAYAEYDDKLADVMKTTGLGKEAIEGLSNSLSKVDTRTSQNELLDLAKQAGKLGISAREDVEAFAIAADKIGVALGEDLGDSEQAINSLGKLSDLFKINDQFGMADAMLKIGSAVNSLGAASTANESYIVDFISRTGGIGKSAKIAITDIMGLGAAFDSLKQPAEASATVINKVVSGMFSKTADYAKVAGMSVKEFSALLKTDANEALLTVLAGFKGADLGYTAKMLGEVGENGAKAAAAVSTIADQVDTVREQQRIANEEFAKGTSILDEFNTKNNTEQAQIEKQQKDFQRELVELGRSIAPIFNAFREGSTTAIAALRSIISIFVEYKGAVAGVALILGSYAISQKISVTWSKLQAFWSGANKTAILAEASALTTATLGTKALVFVKALLVGQFKAVGIAAKSAGVAVKSFFVALGPIGWAITAIGAIATAMSFLKSETKKTAGAFGEMALHISSEKQSYEALRKQLYQTKEGTAERANLIKIVNDHYKEYLPNLLTEKSTTKEIATALDDATGALRRNIQAKTAAAEIEKAEQALYDAKKGAMESLIETYGNYNTAATDTERALVMMQLGGAINYISEYVATAEDAVGTTGRVLQAMGYYMTETNEFGQKIVASYKKPQQSLSRDAEKATADVIAATLQYRAAIAMVQTLTAPYAPGKAPAGDAGDGGGGGGDTPCKKCGKKPCQCDKDDAKAKQKWTLDNDKTFAEKRTALKKQLLDGQIATDEEYSRQMLDLEIATLEQRIAANKEKGEDMAKIKEQLLDKQLQQSKDAKRREDDLLKTAQGGHSDLQKAQREFDDKLKALDLYNKAVADMTDSEHKAYLALEQEFVKKKASITLKHLSDQFALLKKSNDRELADQQIKHNNEFASLSTFAKKKEFLQNKISDKQLASIRTSAQADKAIKAYYATQEANTQRRHLESMISSYREMLAQYKSTGNVADQILSAEDQQALNDRIKQLELELSKLLATASGTETPSTPEQGGKKGGGVDVLGMAPEDWEKMFQNLETSSEKLSAWGAVIGAVGNAMASAFSDISNLMTAIEQRELAAYEKNQNAKKKALDKQLKSGQISQERYNEKIQQLDEQTEAKRIEIERKQAERQKMLAIFQAIVSTAVAVVGALGSMPFGPWNIALAAVVGALGAVQIATIAAQPLPGAEVGGMLVERTQDGKHYNALYEPQRRGAVSRPTVLVGENGTEYVVPADGYANPTIRPVLDLIEQARQSGSLRSINLPAIIAANSATPMAGRSAGGYVSSTQPTNSAAVEPRPSLAVTEILTRLTEILDSLDNKLPLIKAIISENGRDGLGEALDRRDKLINRSKL